MKKYILPIFCLVAVSILFLAPMVLDAQTLNKATTLLEEAGQGAYGGTLPTASLPKLVGKYIRIFLGLLGVLFTILVIYGGYSWMTSYGNVEKTKKAKEVIVDATIGLIIILAAYVITNFVVARLVAETLT